MTREELINDIIAKNSSLKNYTFNYDGEDRHYLGEGGSGYLLLARQNLGDEVGVPRAVKFFIFKDELHSKFGIVSHKNFSQEIVNISKLSHQNIIKVIDGNVISHTINNIDYNIPYIVSEYIEGCDAKTIFDEKNIDKAKKLFNDENVIFDFLLQILEGIIYLHKNNCYHCDIAPKNIFIKQNSDGTFFAIIGDLGALKSFKPSDNSDNKLLVIGTRKYMSPEAIKVKDSEITKKEFKELQPAWDIYSTVISMIEIIDNIKQLDVNNFKQMWNLNLLYDKLEKIKTEQNVSKMEDLKKIVTFLKPMSDKILDLDEISEANNGISQILMPINSACITKRIRDITQHPMFKRLIDVPQLFSGSQYFPGASHTRYEHSLGTYELMRKTMISLMRNAEYRLFFSNRNIVVGLLSALLSSLYCFPFYYAISELNEQNYEIKELSDKSIFEYYINYKDNDLSIWEVIQQDFKDYSIELDEIEYVIFGKASQASVDRTLEIFHIILNSSIGIRVVDYLIRDAHHIGIEQEIDIAYLIKNMTIKDEDFYLKQHGVVYAEQIISNRYWMYKRIYWNESSRANMSLMKNLFYRSFESDQTMKNKLKEESITGSPKDILALLEKTQIKDETYKRRFIKDISFMRQKGVASYRNILFFGRTSEFSYCNLVYNKFIKLTFFEQESLRLKLEKRIIEEYKVPENIIEENGSMILVDCPIGNNKIGEDIEVLRYDDSKIRLVDASGIIKGIGDAFENSLKLIRIYAHPTLYEYLTNGDKTKLAQLQNWLYNTLRGEL